MLSAKKVERLFRVLKETIPTAETALSYKNEFELLIAVMLSAQATDSSVNQATPALFKAAPTPEAMLNLGSKGLESYIKRIGLYRTKAANIIKTCTILVNRFHSKIPDTRESLEILPGVGRKTAGVVLNVAFGKPEIPVDTHVFRVSNRTGLVKAETPLETEEQLQATVPDWVKNKAHHLLILHGRHVCKARKPLCHQCAISDICQYSDKTAP